MTIRLGRRRFAAAVAAAGVALAASAGVAQAAITAQPNTSAGATNIANTIAANAATVTGASYDVIGGGTPNGTSNAPLGGFPTNGTTFGILTSGDVNLADDPNNSGSSSGFTGANARGANDVTILRIALNVPAGNNCLQIDFKFFSEEYPEFVGSQFDDAFIAELDSSTWNAGTNPTSAPNNFAFDENGNPITINSTGNQPDTPGNAAGTTYDGATKLLTAGAVISPGAHVLYLSIFDKGDSSYDSAVFLDNLRFSNLPANLCAQGAQPAVGRMVGNATVSGAKYASIVDCDVALANAKSRPFQIQWSGGTFKVTSYSAVSCFDDPAFTPSPPPQTLAFDTQTGTAGGTLNGASGYTLEWRLEDHGAPSPADATALRITRNSDGAVILNIPLSTLSSGQNYAMASA